MNIHPVFVHFPIALLTVYAILECMRFKFLLRHPAWFYIKAFLLFGGMVGALIAKQTGEIIEHEVEKGALTSIVKVHELWAETTIIIFGILFSLYAVEFIQRELSYVYIVGRVLALPGIRQVWSVIVRVEQIFLNSPAVALGALFGLIAVTITGALGGAMVYGPDIDPIVSFVYHLFF